MKRVVAWIAIGSLLLLVVGGVIVNLASSGIFDSRSGMQRADPGAASSESESPRPVDAAARKAPVPQLQPFYDQQLSWRSCGRHQCAWVEVPLDYAEPTAETIELRLLRVPAGSSERRVGSLVVNPGGPGASGVAYAEQAEYAFGEPLLESYDIVGFDPRGTGQSAPVDCLSEDELDAWYAKDPTPDTPDEVAGATEWSERFGTGCLERSGDLAGHVSTVEAARDLDVIRAVLDERKLTYYGASYGTKLGATYADLFPERSGRLVLDGAVDLSLSSAEASLEQAGGFERALNAYVDHCLDLDECELGDSRAEALDTIAFFLANLEGMPLDVGDRELTAGNAFYGIAMPLYNADYWVLLDVALANALSGDGAALLELFDLYAGRTGDPYADNSSEAIWAINCLDDPAAIEADQVPAEVERFRAAAPTFGEIFAWDLVSCGGLAVPAAPERPAITAAGADPLLVIGTTRDPATPYEWAQALAEQLEPAVLVTRDGDGHTGYNMGNDCVDDVVDAYLIGGETPSGPVDCPAG